MALWWFASSFQCQKLLFFALNFLIKNKWSRSCHFIPQKLLLHFLLLQNADRYSIVLVEGRISLKRCSAHECNLQNDDINHHQEYLHVKIELLLIGHVFKDIFPVKPAVIAAHDLLGESNQYQISIVIKHQYNHH